jgi:hypothetical protein
VVAVSYPFRDIVMLILVVLIVLALAPRGRLSLRFVLVGVVSMAVFDSPYSHLTEIKGLDRDNGLKVAWIVVLLAVVFGGCAATETERTFVSSDRSAVPSLLSLVTSYVIVLPALSGGEFRNGAITGGARICGPRRPVWKL